MCVCMYVCEKSALSSPPSSSSSSSIITSNGALSGHQRPTGFQFASSQISTFCVPLRPHHPLATPHVLRHLRTIPATSLASPLVITRNKKLASISLLTHPQYSAKRVWSVGRDSPGETRYTVRTCRFPPYDCSGFWEFL